MEGLGQIVVSPQIQAFNPVLDLRFCREQQNRCPAPLTADLPENIQTAFDRHHNIEDYAVIIPGVNIIQCLCPVIDCIHLIPVVFQNVYDRFGHSLFIFCKQQSHSCESSSDTFSADILP